MGNITIADKEELAYQNSNPLPTNIITDEGTPVDVQNPLPTDGDSIYCKDIDIDLSDIGTFTGTLCSLFNDYDTELIDISGTNPKTFTLKFKRPLNSNKIAIGSKTGNFSNVKIQLKDLAGTVRTVVDDSANDTKFTSNVYPFVTNVFIEAVVEFHTVDEVKLSGMFIPKIQSRVISSIDGYISETNTSQETLLADEMFTGTQVDTLNYGMILISVFSDVGSATDGLSIQFRSTPTGTWRESDTYTLDAGDFKTFSIQTVYRFMRILYTNGITDQTSFDLQTTLKPVYVKPSSHRVADTINGQDDAELVKANLTAKSTLTDDFENMTSYRETLNVNNAWVHRKIVNETLHQHTGVITNPSIAISEGDTSITVVDATGFVTGDEFKISEVFSGIGIQEIGIITITNVVGNVLTLDRPIGNPYTTAAEIEEVTTNMAVSGTLASPQIFEIDPPLGNIWQFTRMLIAIVDNVTPDDGRFGGIPALTNGVALRATTETGRTVVIANWKTNGDMKLDMFNVDYSDKAPAGNFGVNGRWTLTTAEIVAELNGDASPVQKLEVLIQDDLTDLVSFKMRGQGRVDQP